MDGSAAIADHELVRGLNKAQGELVLWMPPHTNTVPSGSKTALPRLRRSPSGNIADGPQFVAEDRELASMISYELLFEESEPPNTMIRTWGAVLLSSMTDMPLVRSAIAGVTGAMSFQTPVLAPVRRK
jgi:hypothetical protein